MRYLIDDPDMIAWAAETIGMVFRPNVHAIGLAAGSGADAPYRFVACFDDFSSTDCLIHLASDGSRRFASRRDLRAVFSYPFHQLHLPRVSALVSANNQPMLDLMERIGFVREGTKRRAGPHGEDEVHFGMLRSECRWLPLIPAGALSHAGL